VCVHYFVWAGDCVSLCVWARIRGACAESESALDCVGGKFCELMHMGPYPHSKRLRRDCVCSGLCRREILRIYAYGPLSPFEALAPRVCVLWIVCAGYSASQCIWAPIAIRSACAKIVCALDCVCGIFCELMHMGPYRHSKRLRRDCVFSGLCVREILRVDAYGPLSPFEALAPRLCVLWIVWAGDSASRCIWAPIAIRSACAESVCALDCVCGIFCESMHMGPHRHSRCLRRDCVCSGLCGRDILRVYAYGPLSPFEALAPRVCVQWIVWAGYSASLCIWAPIAIRGACAVGVGC